MENGYAYFEAAVEEDDDEAKDDSGTEKDKNETEQTRKYGRRGSLYNLRKEATHFWIASSLFILSL